MHKQNINMSLEKEAKNERRRYMFEQAIRTTLKLGTIIGLAVLAPNAMRIIKLFGWVPTKRNPIYSFDDAITRLKRKGFIRFESGDKDNKNKFLKITDKGKLFLWKLESKYITLPRPNKWDRRWRLIIFDIKEQERFHRDTVRVMLQNIGCVRLQNSVWVYPYDCEEAITLLKANYKIGEEVLYIIAEKIEEDTWLKKYFKLD